MKSNAITICLCIFFCAQFRAFSQSLSYGDIVITEIMADPSPAINLPECEYIEVYNNSKSEIDIAEINLIIGEKSLNTPTYILQPSQYVVFCSSSSKAFFSTQPNVISVPSFPSITNSGKEIIITQNNSIIASLNFSDSWYNNPFKKNGGWSLEKIDVTNGSETSDNWGASSSYNGGTPGSENSIQTANKDINAPEITNIYFENDSLLKISLSENAFIQSIKSMAYGKIESTNYSLRDYTVVLQNKVQKSTQYTIEISLEDFAGNTKIQTYKLALADSLLYANSLIVNEILFNPEVGQSDFVEILNTTNKYFNLQDIYIGKPDFSSLVPLSITPMLIGPGDYLVITEDKLFWEQNSACTDAIFLEVNLPTLADNDGAIAIINKWGEIIDSITYSAKWHSSEILNNEGYTLNRIQKEAQKNQSLNWCSAVPTPGCKNDISTEILIYTDPIELETSYVSIHNIEKISLKIYDLQGYKLFEETQYPNTTLGVFNGTYKDLLHNGIYIQCVEYTLTNKQTKRESMIIKK